MATHRPADGRRQDHSRGSGPDRRPSSPTTTRWSPTTGASPTPSCGPRSGQRRRGDDRPRRRSRRPRRDLVAEHLALGGRLPGHPLRRRRRRPAQHPLHRQRGRPTSSARTGAPLLFALGRVPRRRQGRSTSTVRHLPALRHIVRVPVDDAPTAPGTSSSPAAPTSTPVDARAAAVRPDDVSDILFTSGTTGRSKGVLCAHRQSLDAPAAWAACGELTSADRYLCINPFFHNFGYKAGILACLQTGATLIPQLTFDPEQAMRGRRRTTASPCCPGRRRSTRRCSTTRSAPTTT